MTSPRLPRISLVGLGVQSAAMASLLEALPVEVSTPMNSQEARAAARDPGAAMVLDGAESPDIAATRIRRLGLDEILSNRIDSGGALMICSNSALALANGRLSGAIRGLGIVPAEILRVPGFPTRGVRRINGARSERAWFEHEYMFMTQDEGWGPPLLPTGLLARNGTLVCAFDPARSAGFGRAFVMDWIQRHGSSREEAA